MACPAAILPSCPPDSCQMRPLNSWEGSPGRLCWAAEVPPECPPSCPCVEGLGGLMSSSTRSWIVGPWPRFQLGSGAQGRAVRAEGSPATPHSGPRPSLPRCVRPGPACAGSHTIFAHLTCLASDLPVVTQLTREEWCLCLQVVEIVL